MRRVLRRTTWACLVVGWALWGCESQPPAGEQTQPPTRPAPKPAPDTARPTPPPPPPPTEVPREEAAAPELPDYLAVVSKGDLAPGYELQVLTVAGRKLSIDTRNVQRLRIDRDKLPLETDRSIALILDGQGFEWRADSDIEEFVRSPNGVWEPVKPEDEAPRYQP